MDDVGQTLLNWASAFGTQEMVREGGGSEDEGVAHSSSSRWSFCVKEVLMSTEVRGHLHYTTLLVLDVHK